MNFKTKRKLSLFMDPIFNKNCILYPIRSHPDWPNKVLRYVFKNTALMTTLNKEYSLWEDAKYVIIVYLQWGGGGSPTLGKRRSHI